MLHRRIWAGARVHAVGGTTLDAACACASCSRRFAGGTQKRGTTRTSEITATAATAP